MLTQLLNSLQVNARLILKLIKLSTQNSMPIITCFKHHYKSKVSFSVEFSQAFRKKLYHYYVHFMLRSQIKLTSYDFSDLHNTGEFDNRPGTGRFLRIFFCVVTYRTGTGRRLYMKTSADARPGNVRRRTVPGRRCKRFYTYFHLQ